MSIDSGTFFQSVEKPRLSQEVARQIALAIREGRFLPGHALPPERELTVIFDVSRPILREALQYLVMQGLITVRHGRGAFVNNLDEDILNVPLASWLEKNESLIQDYYEARIAIEPVCAFRAARRATDVEIASLRAMIATEEHLIADNNLVAFVGADIDFHAAVARISSNRFLSQIINSLIVPETDVRKIILRLPEHLPVAHLGHQKVFKAIENHDPDGAREAMISALNAPLAAIKFYITDQEPD